MRRAASSVIRQSDLISSFRPEPGGWGEPRIPTCTDYPGNRSRTTITGKAASSFTDGFDVMGSKALFFKSRVDAVNYWKKTAASAFAACNAWAITQNLKPGATATPMEARALPAPATGADATAAYRTVTQFDVPDHPSYDWYETTVFVRAGRALGIAHVGYANQVCECYAGMARLLTQRLRAASR